MLVQLNLEPFENRCIGHVGDRILGKLRGRIPKGVPKHALRSAGIGNERPWMLD